MGCGLLWWNATELNNLYYQKKTTLRKFLWFEIYLLYHQFNTVCTYISIWKSGARTRSGPFPVAWRWFFLSMICRGKFAVWLERTCLKHSFKQVWWENLPLVPAQKRVGQWVSIYLEKTSIEMMQIRQNSMSYTWRKTNTVRTTEQSSMTLVHRQRSLCHHMLLPIGF